jgi:XTP/dITP diphosphohydrolase
LEEFSSPPSAIEDQPDFCGNAVKKAEMLRDYCHGLVLADDSGLEVDILGGYPGVYSARFAGEGASDEDNNRKLLYLLQGIPLPKRRARFRCAIAIAYPGLETSVVEGECEGYIGFEPRGESGFGYDPLFVYAPKGMTFAELGEDFKNKISHRAQALRRVKTKLREILQLI